MYVCIVYLSSSYNKAMSCFEENLKFQIVQFKSHYWFSSLLNNIEQIFSIFFLLTKLFNSRFDSFRPRARFFAMAWLSWFLLFTSPYLTSKLVFFLLFDSPYETGRGTFLDVPGRPIDAVRHSGSVSPPKWGPLFQNIWSRATTTSFLKILSNLTSLCWSGWWRGKCQILVWIYSKIEVFFVIMTDEYNCL